MNDKTKYLVKDLNSGLEFYLVNASKPTLTTEVIENESGTKTKTQNSKWNTIEFDYAVVKE
jgi:hypothetical protein